MLKNVEVEKFLDFFFFKFDNIILFLQEDKLVCENFIFINECLNVLKEFISNKIFGIDGFIFEFYKFFWLELCIEMIVSFNYVFYLGILFISQKRGIILFIFKKDKDILLLENLRFILLLNVDYKIFIKVIVKRLEKLLLKIINFD